MVSEDERGRLRAPSHRVEGGAYQTLLLVHGSDGSWTIHTDCALRIQADVMATVCQAVLRHARAWYLRSTDDHDTHRGKLSRGRVAADCGIEFTPLCAGIARPALPGDPPDPDQICPPVHRQKWWCGMNPLADRATAARACVVATAEGREDHGLVGHPISTTQTRKTV
jgi:hypothetical protein